MLSMHGTKLFDCPISMEEMKPPMKIFQCSNGHALCGQCKDNPVMTSCPICRIVFTGSNVSRNILAESLAREMNSTSSIQPNNTHSGLNERLFSRMTIQDRSNSESHRTLFTRMQTVQDRTYNLLRDPTQFRDNSAHVRLTCDECNCNLFGSR